MRYAQIRKYDIANGPGIRSSIFVTGCTICCKDCFNEDYQNFNFGNPWTDKQTEKLISYLKLKEVRGLTILGGEPFCNTEGLLSLVLEIRRQVDTNIWIYSGFTFENLLLDKKNKQLLEKCDTLVDGRFMIEKRDLNLRFRGSSNQRIIDLKKSFETKKIILMEEYYK